MPFFTKPQWYIDNVAINQDTADFFGATVDPNTNILTFLANKPLGELYSVTYGALYNQDNLIKKILNSSFGVQLNEFYEKQFGASIEIEMVSSLNGITSAATSAPRKILATLLTDIPVYIMFLLRVVLTAGVLLFSTWIISSFVPRGLRE
jgi:hypothetical protein